MDGKWAHQPAVWRRKRKRLRLPVSHHIFKFNALQKYLCVNSPAVNGEVYCEFSLSFPRAQFFGCAPSRPARSQWTLKWLREERNWTLAQLNNSRVLFTSATCFCLYTLLSAQSGASRPKILRKGFPLKHSINRIPANSVPFQLHSNPSSLTYPWKLLW